MISDYKYSTWMIHGAMTNVINKECMLEDLLMVIWTNEDYQVASEGDTCTWMNYQVNTKTIKESVQPFIWRWSYGKPWAHSSLRSTTNQHEQHKKHVYTCTMMLSCVMSLLRDITTFSDNCVINVMKYGSLIGSQMNSKNHVIQRVV